MRFNHRPLVLDRGEKGVYSSYTVPEQRQQLAQAWLCNSQVNFCAKAYLTVPLTHEDAAPLVILGNLLRNIYLHKTIREQGGAYGGGASQDNSNGAFRFYSYRDPRLKETLDKSESPAGRAKREYHSCLHGRTREIRQRFREGVLACKGEDLKRVAERYLQPENANTAVICDFSKRDLVSESGLEIREI